MITTLSILIIIVLGYNIRGLIIDRSKPKAKGIILDYWNKYHGAILGMSTFLVVAYLGVPQDTFNEVFGHVGEIVRLADGVAGLIGMIILAYEGYRKPKI